MSGPQSCSVRRTLFEAFDETHAPWPGHGPTGRVPRQVGLHAFHAGPIDCPRHVLPTHAGSLAMGAAACEAPSVDKDVFPCTRVASFAAGYARRGVDGTGTCPGGCIAYAGIGRTRACTSCSISPLVTLDDEAAVDVDSASRTTLA